MATHYTQYKQAGGRETAWLLGCEFESRQGHGCWTLLCLVCCVGNGICDKPITRSEKSYPVRVSNCVRLNNVAVKTRTGLYSQQTENYLAS